MMGLLFRWRPIIGLLVLTWIVLVGVFIFLGGGYGPLATPVMWITIALVPVCLIMFVTTRKQPPRDA